MTSRTSVERCAHGISFTRLPTGEAPTCHECDLIWHQMCLASSITAVEHHKRKVDEAIAAISRTCGDA